MTPDEEFCRWAAGALIDRLRTRQAPEGIFASSFVWEPMLRCLREVVTSDDLDLILDLLAQPETRMFGGLLSRGLPDDVRLTSAVVNAFREETNAERKLGLFHQVVARPVDHNVKNELAEWAEANAKQLIEDQRKFFFGDDVRQRLDDRMRNPAFERKRWVYLYSAHALNDSESVRSLLHPYLQDPDPLMARAARVSMAYLVD